MNRFINFLRAGMIRNRKEPNFLMGIYPDWKQASKALRLLRRNRFFRSACISVSKDGRRRVTNHLPVFVPALLISVGILTISVLMGEYSLASAALIAGACCLIGVVLGPKLKLALPGNVIEEYAPKVFGGEAMLLVQCASNDVAHLNNLLQSIEAGKPILFVIRPYLTDEVRGVQTQHEMLSAEQLGLYATACAVRHKLSPPMKPQVSFLKQLSHYERTLENVRTDLAQAGDLEQSISSSAEWLLDNAYIIQNHIHDIRRNLPSRYHEIFPALDGEAGDFNLRILRLALEIANKTDGNITAGSMHTFLDSYQKSLPLSIAELWAFPLMVRYALIEDLAHQSLRVSQHQHDREWAHFWANRLLSAAHRCPERVPMIFSEINGKGFLGKAHFILHLMDQIVGEEAIFSEAQHWIKERGESSFADIIRREHARQSAKQISIANDVNSLRRLAQLDWRESFEKLSLVEAVLRQDTVYAMSDFATRDACRRAVEAIARHSKSQELDVAERAVQYSRPHVSDRHGHVAYFLIDKGRKRLESSFGYKSPLPEHRLRWMLEHSSLLYFSGIAGGIVVLLSVGLVQAVQNGIRFWPLLGFAVASLLPASEVSIQISNYVLSRWIPPHFIPRMSFHSGIPDEFRTLVVVPTILLTPESTRCDIERLEVRYLANREKNLLFALLTDFADAPSREMPADPELLGIAVRGIEGLNARYPNGQFFLFHREREWCATERKWIGWERKRGKLEDLNRYLNCEMRGPIRNFLKVGSADALQRVRFVITLDADTKLPHQSALRLVEAMAHPLNRAVFSPDGRTICDGYGIIQPRVVAGLPSIATSRFASMFANAGGTDPYARAISDPYQDLFGESIFIGKAIYDVRAFHQILSGAFPEQTLLSHDLIEGNYLRVGFDSTVLLFEQFPSNYQTFCHRQHRWIRGDWQIAEWILPRVPDGNGERATNPLSKINRWKILDNLRRSLVPPACILVLAGSWLIMPNSLFWNFFIALAIWLPAITPIPTRVREGMKGYFFVWRNQALEFLRAIVTTSLLPCQSWISVDAAIRAWIRRYITHRNLLQWETAQAVHWRSANNRKEILIRTGIISAGTILWTAVLAYRGFSVWAAAAPYLVLWFLSPLVFHWINLPMRPKKICELKKTDQLYLRKIARSTWRFFDDLVGPQSHWLPPDNIQESPRVEVAYRTSPTNIGIWLLSATAAYDFGFLTQDQFVERLSASFQSICRLETHRGHLLNWYDIKTLQPLLPRYVSTVDSGNLLASLWTLDRGLAELRSSPIVRPDSLKGLADAASLLDEWIQKCPSVSNATRSALSDICQWCRQDCGGLQLSWELIHKVDATCSQYLTPEKANGQICPEDPKTAEEIKYWIDTIVSSAREWASLMKRYFGWVPLLCEPPGNIRQSLASDRLICRLLGGTSLSLAVLASEDTNPLSQIGQKLDVLSDDSFEWKAELKRKISQAQSCAREMLGKIESTLDRSRHLQEEMRLGRLYDADRKLFVVGQQVDESPQTSSHYDLLASEARLTSLLAIARGEIPPEHWQALGRPFGIFSGHKFLYSWSGSMFEYLMPLIFTGSYENSLLRHACDEAVSIQIKYGRSQGVPWGISESAFSDLDIHRIYQYRAFGVPVLGLRRDPGEDLVVAPYATALALMVDPLAAIKNMKQLECQGLYGSRGFYEAIDYSREGREGKRGTIVQAYMGHHQGMSLLSMDNVLLNNRIQRRFRADPSARAVESLLYEGIPPSRDVTYLSPAEEKPPSRLIARTAESIAKPSCNEQTPNPPDSTVFEWRLFVHDNQFGRRIQPMAGFRPYTLAGGSDARSLGRLLLYPGSG